jgi:nicotinamidase-related amidase
MAALDGRRGRALLVVDLQQGVVDIAHRGEEVLTTVADLVERARTAQVPVIWVQHHDAELERGTPAWQWADGLEPAGTEPLVEKSHGDAFAGTGLERILAERGVSEIVLVGAVSEQCIRATMHSAVIRGYDVALVAGGHTTVDGAASWLPDPEAVIGVVDAMAEHGMQWPGSRARSVVPEAVGF